MFGIRIFSTSWLPRKLDAGVGAGEHTDKVRKLETVTTLREFPDV
jgi:hypothetical protein